MTVSSNCNKDDGSGAGQSYNDSDAMAFLLRAGDEELLRFLRRLPMVSANADDSPVTIEGLIYDMKLWPFVKDAYLEVESEPGVAGRIMQINRVYKLAAQKMERMNGEKRRTARIIDIGTFLSIYSTEGLP